MLAIDDRYRPHGDEWRWRLGPPRSMPSISVTVTTLTPADRDGRRRAFGFARELCPDPVDPLLWEGD